MTFYCKECGGTMEQVWNMFTCTSCGREVFAPADPPRRRRGQRRSR